MRQISHKGRQIGVHDHYIQDVVEKEEITLDYLPPADTVAGPLKKRISLMGLRDARVNKTFMQLILAMNVKSAKSVKNIKDHG